MFKRSVLTAAAVGLVASTFGMVAPTRAAVGVKVGELSCHVAGGWGFVFGSSRNLLCTYTGNGQVAHYAGVTAKFGVDIGYLQSGVLVWMCSRQPPIWGPPRLAAVTVASQPGRPSASARMPMR